MKKLILILLTAAIAAAGCGAAGCSKGQTGGGNNTLSGITRSAQDGGYDCGCGDDCKCEGNCNDDCDCGENCKCGEKDGDDIHGKDGRGAPRGKHSGGMDNFEFDRGIDGKNLGERRGKFGFFTPGDGFMGREPMPVPPPPPRSDDNGANNVTEDESKQDTSAQQNDKTRKGERRRKDGRRIAPGEKKRT